MAVKIRETELVLSRRLEERSVEVTASGSLRLPSELPDAATPIRWKALASVDRVVADAASGRLEARGTLRGWVVYAAAGSESPDPAGAVFGGRLEGELPFTASTDLPPDAGDAAWQARATVRDVEGRFRTDGRTADVDVVISVRFAGVVRERTTAVSQVSATPPDRVETSSATLRVSVFQGEGRARLALEEAHGLDLPAGPTSRLRVLDLQVEPTITAAEPHDGGVLARGELAFELLYAVQRQAPAEGPPPGPSEASAPGTGEQPEVVAPVRLWDVHLASWTSPEGFETTIPIAGLEGTSRVRARAQLADASVRTLPAEGLVYITCQVDVEAQAVDARTVPVVADIRSSGPQTVEQRKVPLRLESPAGEGRRTFTGGATVELSGALPPVDRIVWSGVVVDAISTRPEAGRVHVSASATPWAYYLPYKPDARTNGVVFAFWPGAVNIEQVVAIPDLRPDAEISASFTGLSVEADLISRQTVEFTVSGQCLVEAQLPATQEVVAEAVAVRAPGPRQPSIYLVVTQPNDTLWKLARRYRTTPQQVQSANPDLGAREETEPLPAGSRLFIMGQ
ncbi:MAG: LysM domain-containing protein [Bacillota bacterium]